MNAYPDTLQGRLGALLGDPQSVYGLGVSGLSISDYLALSRLARDEFKPAAAVFLLSDGDISESILDQTGHYSFSAKRRWRCVELSSARRRQHLPQHPHAHRRHLALSLSAGEPRAVAAASLPRGRSAKLRQQRRSRRSARTRRLYPVVDYFLRNLPATLGLPPRCIVFLLDSDRYAIYKPELASKRIDDPQLRDYFQREATARGFRVADLDPIFRRSVCARQGQIRLLAARSALERRGAQRRGDDRLPAPVRHARRELPPRQTGRDAMNAGIRAVLRTLSPAGSRARLSILIFHRVHPVPDSLYPDEPDARRFTEILDWAANWFNVLPLPEAVERLRSGSLPDRAAAITFDDGYADNCVVALPILRQHGMHATFFVATAFMNGGRMWNDTVIEAVRRVATPEFDLERAKLGGLPNRIARREARDGRGDSRRDQVPASRRAGRRGERDQGCRRGTAAGRSHDERRPGAPPARRRDGDRRPHANASHPREMHTLGRRSRDRERARRSRRLAGTPSTAIRLPQRQSPGGTTLRRTWTW